MNLDEKNWKPFLFGSLIDEMYKAKAHAKVELTILNEIQEDFVPFVTRTEVNNGVDCYVLKNDLQNIEEGNAIVVGDTTSTISYQAQPFGTGDHIIVIRAKWLNIYTGLFIVALLQKERFRYSYGRAYLRSSIQNTKLLLPINEFSEPDWEWMEYYIKSLNYKPITTRVEKSSIKINTSSWKEYRLDYLFDFEKGKRLIKEDMEEGTTNYLGAISVNNGVRQKIQCEMHEQYQPNCITVNYNGSVGEAFYQREPFWASDDVNVLYAKSWWHLNVFIAMFIITVIRSNKYKFDYGRKWTLEKMTESTILLPKSKDGTPDWKWMEEFVQSLPHSDRILA